MVEGSWIGKEVPGEALSHPCADKAAASVRDPDKSQYSLWLTVSSGRRALLWQIANGP